MDRRRRRTATRKALPQRYFFAFLALAVAMVQLFGLGHLVFVSHAICEHGALLHTEDATVHAEAAAAARDADGVSSALPGRGAAEHQHCDALAVRPAVIAVQPAFEAPAELEGALLPETPRALVAHPPIAVLALAPKVSPPLRSS
jgi:hypothetical protein